MKMTCMQNSYIKQLLVLFMFLTIATKSGKCAFSNNNSHSVKLLKDDLTIEQFDIEKLFKRIDTIEHSPLVTRNAAKMHDEKHMKDSSFSKLEKEMLTYVQNVLDIERYNLTSGLSIWPMTNDTTPTATPESDERSNFLNEEGRGFDDIDLTHVTNYVQKHVLNVDIPETGRLFFKGSQKTHRKRVFPGRLFLSL